MHGQNSVISARIPKEIRDQGDVALKRIDSTVTELVNSAFEYVIKTGSLPAVPKSSGTPGEKIKRTFSPEQKTEFTDYLKATSAPLSSTYASLSAKQIKEMRLAEKYGE